MQIETCNTSIILTIHTKMIMFKLFTMTFGHVYLQFELF